MFFFPFSLLLFPISSHFASPPLFFNSYLLILDFFFISLFEFNLYPRNIPPKLMTHGGYLCLVSLLHSASDTEPRRLSSY